MGKVIGFRPRPWRRRAAPRRRRRSGVPWIPAALIVAGIFGYFALDHRAGDAATGVEARDDIQAPETPGFVLCSWVARDNCVIDGDTIRYRGDRIRLADIDTPEVSEPKCASEAERGRRATQRLLELVNDGPVRLVRVGSRDRDRYGRKLRIVERAGRSVGDVLVAEGLARRWDGARRSWCG